MQAVTKRLFLGQRVQGERMTPSLSRFPTRTSWICIRKQDTAQEHRCAGPDRQAPGRGARRSRELSCEKKKKKKKNHTGSRRVRLLCQDSSSWEPPKADSRGRSRQQGRGSFRVTGEHN